jgi:excisionase family DNA binding protein
LEEGKMNWLSVEQLAVYLGVSKETIYRMIKRNTIPKHRIGKLWKFNKDEVDKYILKRKSV